AARARRGRARADEAGLVLGRGRRAAGRRPRPDRGRARDPLLRGARQRGGAGRRTEGFGTGRPARARLAPALALATAPAVGAQEGPVLPLDTLRVDVASRTAADLPARSRAIEVLDAARLRSLPVRTVAEALQWMTGMDLQPRSAAQTDLAI